MIATRPCEATFKANDKPAMPLPRTRKSTSFMPRSLQHSEQDLSNDCGTKADAHERYRPASSHKRVRRCRRLNAKDKRGIFPTHHRLLTPISDVCDGNQ